MDFNSRQGPINIHGHSNSSTIARICNAALGKKMQFYVPDSMQHHTRTRALGAGATPCSLALVYLDAQIARLIVFAGQ